MLDHCGNPRNGLPSEKDHVIFLCALRYMLPDHLECITWLAGFLFIWEKSRRGGGGGRGTRGVWKGISGEEEQ